jgi:hypothetical protein
VQFVSSQYQLIQSARLCKLTGHKMLPLGVQDNGARLFRRVPKKDSMPALDASSRAFLLAERDRRNIAGIVELIDRMRYIETFH